ncbi:hypothetical protein Btru_075886 [Bulinus truncatus]|nr:hypothetical protein Btru_075886 [Bulinus truncatus]
MLHGQCGDIFTAPWPCGDIFTAPWPCGDIFTAPWSCGDGKLDFSEFVAFMKKYIRSSGDNGSLSMFFHFDRDGDGFISPVEFKESMKLLGVNLTTAESEGMLFPYFKNNEKKIGYEDFRILMQRFI